MRLKHIISIGYFGIGFSDVYSTKTYRLIKDTIVEERRSLLITTRLIIDHQMDESEGQAIS